MANNKTSSNAAGKQVRAFVPSALPPQPPLALTNGRQRLLERATLALGRLDSITLLLPDPQIFLYSYVRREAVLSSQIEGAQTSLAEQPLLTLNEVYMRANLSFATAAKAMDRLIGAGSVSELTGRQSNRVFAYDRYLAILNIRPKCLPKSGP